MKPELPWFKHENNAHQHPKFEALMGIDGFAAYGRFWILNEVICQQEHAVLDVSRKVNKLSLARKLGYSEQELDEFLHFLSDPDIRLIQNDNGIITTDRTQESLTLANKKRAADRARAAKNSTPPHEEDTKNSQSAQQNPESPKKLARENDDFARENGKIARENAEFAREFSTSKPSNKIFPEPEKFCRPPEKFLESPKNFIACENDEFARENGKFAREFSHITLHNKTEEEEGEKERACEPPISTPWKITPLNPEIKNLTDEVMKLWYNRLFKIKGTMIRPGNEDEHLIAAALARLDFNRDSALSAVNEYWSNWQEYWFAVMRGDMKKPRDQRRPQFSFRQFCGSIDQLVKSTNPEPEESRIAKVQVSEMF